MNYQKMDFIELLEKGPFSNLGILGTITLQFLFAYSFLGMILINCQEMDFIELFKCLFSKSERSGLAHFPIIIDII